MHGAPPAHFDLAPSRMALFAIGVAAAATSGVVLTLPWPLAATTATVLAVLAWAADRAHVVALRRGSRAVRDVEITAGLQIRAGYGDGTVRTGQVDRSTCVTSWITTLVWRPEGGRFTRAVLILPDMLPSEDFRRLRVTLRYGRSEPTQGAPASHA